MNSTPAPPVLEFHRREPVRQGLRRLGGILATAARAQAGRPPGEQDAAVHEMRRLLKRLRALVRLLRPTVGEAVARRHNQRLRRAAHRLAGARDATVGLITLDALTAEASSDTAAALREIRQRFAVRVHDRHTRKEAVARALGAAAAAIADSTAALDRIAWKRRGWTTLEAGIRAGYRRARRRAGVAQSSRDESRYHAWRTTAKSLLYQVGLLRPIRPARLGPWLRALDDLQDRLGREHDLAVLAARIARTPRAFGNAGTVKQVLERIANRQQALRKECLRGGRKLFAKRPADFVAGLRTDWRKWRKR